MQVGVHARLEHRDAAELIELRRVGIVVERAGDQHIEAGVAGLARGRDQIGARDGAELRADEDGGAFLGSPCAFDIAALGADQVARPGRDGRERDLVFLVRLLDSRRSSGSPESSGRNPVRRRFFDLAAPSISSSFSSTASTRCGERLSTVNGPATRTLRLSS